MGTRKDMTDRPTTDERRAVLAEAAQEINVLATAVGREAEAHIEPGQEFALLALCDRLHGIADVLTDISRPEHLSRFTREDIGDRVRYAAMVMRDQREMAEEREGRHG